MEVEAPHRRCGGSKLCRGGPLNAEAQALQLARLARPRVCHALGNFGLQGRALGERAKLKKKFSLLLFDACFFSVG